MYFKLLADLKKDKISLKKFLFWIFVWFALSVIVFFPQAIIALAGLVGIQRPQDLPIYVSIIILFILMFKIGLKIERIEQEITKIVKIVALKEIKKK